jgi:hypothetical protein
VASPWTGLDHLASGLLMATSRPIQTRFRYGSCGCLHNHINLATTNNSPDHSSTGTLLPIHPLARTHRARTACMHTASGTFHSASAVLFTFPSRYWFTIGRTLIFSLGEWSPQVPTGFHVPDGTQELTQEVGPFSPTGLSPSLAGLSRPFN